jgi:hypothetical protein
MGKVWVLDTETKGTGAHMVPFEKTLERTAPAKAPARPDRPATRTRKTAERRPPRRSGDAVETTSTPLPPGHVRKKATGEIGEVQSVDAKAGTATVRWLKRGAASTVPLSAISRR